MLIKTKAKADATQTFIEFDLILVVACITITTIMFNKPKILPNNVILQKMAVCSGTVLSQISNTCSVNKMMGIAIYEYIAIQNSTHKTTSLCILGISLLA